MAAFKILLPADRFVLAFYGIQASTGATEGFFHCVVQWMTSLGHAPDKLGISGAECTGKLREYRRGLAALEKSGFSQVDSFSVHASLPSARISLTQYSTAASFSRSAAAAGFYAVVAVPSTFASKANWLSIVKQIVGHVRPAYGIGFERPLALGPIFYALGICCGGDPAPTGDAYDEARNISRWSNLGMVRQVYRQGLLRDIFPWNFLTKPQLDKEIGGMPLAKWIQKDGGRGRLDVLCDDVWLWEVDPSQQAAKRKELQRAGTIFDWRKYL
jgi:hypothetical protein